MAAVVPKELATPARTPAKTPRRGSEAKSRTTENRRVSENVDPNLPAQTPSKKKSVSDVSPAAGSKSATSRQPRAAPPQPPAALAQGGVRERKFIVAKKRTGARKDGSDRRNSESFRQAAYEALRVSQEEFFKKKDVACSRSSSVVGTKKGDGSSLLKGEDDDKERRRNSCNKNGVSEEEEGMAELRSLEGSSKVRKMKSIVMEEARRSLPEAGRVKHLVKAFESILSISKSDGSAEGAGENKGNTTTKWPLPGLQPPPLPPPKLVPSSPSSLFSSAEFSFQPKAAQLDSRLYSSTDSANWRLSSGSRASSRRNSTDSSVRNWSKKLKVTSQQPFKLRTEQRGRLKEEHFIRKVKEIIMQEEKLRIPIAQGLPWTTDEPECLVKPPVKEATEAMDLILHSDMRAMERAEFDQYMTKRMTLGQQKKLEMERQQRLEEEERIKQLRKELVPRAQPMPFFDKPFIPKRSTRPRTVPKEPKFHLHHHDARRKCVQEDTGDRS